MARELTEQELQFIEEEKSRRDAMKEEVTSSTELKRRARAKRVPFWKKLPFWAGVTMAVPTLAAISLMLYIYRAETLLGAGVISWMSKQELTPEIRKTASESGLDWLPPLLTIYSNRWLIIAALITVGVVLSGGLLVLDSIRNGGGGEDEQLEEDE